MNSNWKVFRTTLVTVSRTCIMLMGLKEDNETVGLRLSKVLTSTALQGGHVGHMWSPKAIAKDAGVLTVSAPQRLCSASSEKADPTCPA